MLQKSGQVTRYSVGDWAINCLTCPVLRSIISTNVLYPRRIATCDHHARVWRSLGLTLFSARGGEQADREGIIKEGVTADQRSVEPPR